MSPGSTSSAARTNLNPIFQRWGLVALVCLLLAALWVFIFAVSSAQKERLLSDNARELAGLNDAVTQQVIAMFRQAESNLHTIDRWLQANPNIDPRTDIRLAGLAEDLRRGSGGLIEVRMASSDGNVYFIPTLDGKPVANVKDRAHFTVPIEKPNRELYIGDPLLSRISKKWVLPISWRLESAVSDIKLLYAAVELERLFVLHERLRPKPNGAITVLRLDGVVLSRTPYDQAFIGKNLSGLATFKNEYSIKERGIFISDSALTDRITRQVSYQRLEEFPIVVLVTEAVEDILAPYYRSRSLALWMGGLLTLIALLITFILQRSIQALQSAQDELTRHASTDSLTGIMNRRMFNEMAQREFKRAQRYDRPTSLLMLDIDHFKKINDSYGHAIGDVVLQECAKAWQALLRPQDLFGRVGGEEFCVLLVETPREHAHLVAERMREAIMNLQLRAVSDRLSVTVSIGFSGITRADEQLAQAIARADRALYHAKETGRNKTVSLDEAPHAAAIPAGMPLPTAGHIG